MPFRSSYPPELERETILLAIGSIQSPDGHAPVEAFAKVYLRYESRVRNAVARAATTTGRPHRIDELRQEVWCRFADRERGPLRHYKPERGSFGPFVGMVAYQQALAICVSLNRRVTDEVSLSNTVEDPEVEDPSVSETFAQLIQSDLYDKLMKRAQAELSEDDLRIIREIYFEGRSVLATARHIDVNPNTLSKRHQRLKARLRTMAEELLAPATPGERRSLVTALLLLASSWFAPATDGAESVTPENPSEADPTPDPNEETT